MRYLVAALCAAALAAALPAAPASPSGSSPAFALAADAGAASARLSSTERGVVQIMNRIRARHGLRRLRVSRALARAADRHSRDMLAHDFFAHHSSNGTPFHRRVRRFARARRVGENLALVSRGGARRIVDMWLSSPGHRAVLLSRRFRRVGVARRSGRLASFRGAVFTADFASRR